MGQTELTPDQKGFASLTLGEVIKQTGNNFPDPKYHPTKLFDSAYYHQSGIDVGKHKVSLTADGIGTKPEIAERMYHMTGNPAYFEGLAFDTFAMVKGDVDRFGYFLLGVANIADVNTADPNVISALAKGAKAACDEGHFAMINGETAELGYRTSGYGETRVNWNAVGLMLINPDKVILGDKLKLGQPIVGLQEKSIRSNGLSKARAIAEAAYLKRLDFSSKQEYIFKYIDHYIGESLAIIDMVGKEQMLALLDSLLGHNFLEQVLLPWHKEFPELAKELLRPSNLYGKLMYEAQGGVDGPKNIEVTGAAHISGGGVPEKTKRMVQPYGLGASFETIFSDPEGIRLLLELNRDLPKPLVDDIGACEQWNRGLGFLMVTPTYNEADNLIRFAHSLGQSAEIVGEIIEKPQIEWRGHTWTYSA